MARDAGAKNVYFASAAPAVKFPNVYGIDMPAAQELIAYGKSLKEIEQLIGADRLVYQDLEDLVSAAQEGNPSISEFDCSVFNGEYVTGDIDDAYLQRIEVRRNDLAKQDGPSDVSATNNDEGLIDLHNAS